MHWAGDSGTKLFSVDEFDCCPLFLRAVIPTGEAKQQQILGDSLINLPHQ